MHNAFENDLTTSNSESSLDSMHKISSLSFSYSQNLAQRDNIIELNFDKAFPHKQNIKNFDLKHNTKIFVKKTKNEYTKNPSFRKHKVFRLKETEKTTKSLKNEMVEILKMDDFEECR